MSFAVLPAVDVAHGQAVRLVKGDAATGTTHGHARDAVLAWEADGAEWIHLVDLDAALGRGSNGELLASLIGELDVKVQLSGGIHDDTSLAAALATGCERAVVGTAALADPAWCSRAIAAHGERIAFGLDVRVVERVDGSVRHRLAARGVTRDGGDLWAALARLDGAGCARYVVTDVGTDGRLCGPNVELMTAVARASAASVIASGGIAAIEDLALLAEAAVAAANLEGSVVGSALYAGRFTLPEALRAVRRTG